METLGLDTSSGLVSQKSRQTPDQVSQIWRKANDIGVDAVYFINNLPVIYFHRLDHGDPDTIRKLHRLVWNQGRVPFLFVISPGQIRVYNGYAIPSLNSEQFSADKQLLYPNPQSGLPGQLEQLVSIEEARERIDRELGVFNRESIDSGYIWQNRYITNAIDFKTRVDRRLLRNLKAVRFQLHESGLDDSKINRLLIRSLFVMYLQDRQALPNDCWPTQARDFFSILQEKREAAFKLFDRLSERYNGNLLPITDQEQVDLNEDHLEILRRFLLGSDMQSGQVPLFPLYDFAHIPIEMISSIYEEFLSSPIDNQGQSEQQNTGAFYTPPTVVSMLLDECLSTLTTNYKMRILDPACGSGVFLVLAYHRLVEQWKKANRSKKISASILKKIMTTSIFGVDLNSNAIRVAAFSLYLGMLDYLQPDYIRRRMKRFPVLIDRNLFEADFFDPEPNFNSMEFDLVIGNPPWQSKLTPLAEKYRVENELEISDNQIAQAFLWRAPELCNPEGEICLMVSSKSILYNEKAQKFRSTFFSRYDVNTILNLSALRRERGIMFSKAVGPAAAIFAKPRAPDSRGTITYLTPKPSPRSRWMGIPILDASEIKFLSRTQPFQDNDFWKSAFWGTARDVQLIQKLKSFPRLKNFLASHVRVKPQEGYKIVDGAIRRPEMKGRPSISSNAEIRYVIRDDETKPLDREYFYSIKNPAIYDPPLLVIKQSPVRGELYAALSEKELVYSERFAGITTSPEGLPFLKLLALYFNSALSTYYYFMTAGEWGVERDNFTLTQHLEVPFVAPEISALQDSKSVFRQLLNIFDEISRLRHMPHSSEKTESEYSFLRENADNLLFELFELTRSERDLVSDTVQFTIPFAFHPTASRATDTPDSGMLDTYSQIVESTFNDIFSHGDSKLNRWVYPTTNTLSVVGFGRAGSDSVAPSTIGLSDESTDKLLSQLNDKLSSPRGVVNNSLYVRRHARIYDGDTIYVIKPSEKRFWTRSMARNDADEIIAELLAEYKQRNIGIKQK